MKPTVALCSRLKAARFAMGYETAKAFAESFDIRYTSHIQREKGTRPISLKIIYEYADWLNINPDWLLTGHGHPCPEHPEAEKKQKQIYAVLHHEATEKAQTRGYAELSSQTKEILINFSLFYDLLLRFEPNIKSEIQAAINVYNQLASDSHNSKLMNTLIKAEQATLKKNKSKA